jgi:hypothetical protein
MAAVPRDLPRKYHDYWRRPWEPAAYRSLGFRRWCKQHGYLSPHFKVEEARSHDGRSIPRRYRWRCRRHAFRLERIRHWTGDKPVPIVSWYRSPEQNRKVRGAKNSRHMRADATDHPKQWVDAHHGQGHCAALARKAGCKGIGVYPGGNLHFDDRPVAAFWTSW